MKSLLEHFFIALLAISTVTPSVVYADSVTCPTPQPIKNFASTLSADDFQVDGPGIPGNYLFEVKNSAFTFENHEWHLASVVHAHKIDNINQARLVALQTCLTLDDGTVAVMQETDNGYICMYKTHNGGLIVGTEKTT